MTEKKYLIVIGGKMHEAERKNRQLKDTPFRVMSIHSPRHALMGLRFEQVIVDDYAQRVAYQEKSNDMVEFVNALYYITTDNKPEQVLMI